MSDEQMELVLERKLTPEERKSLILANEVLEADRLSGLKRRKSAATA
jgi:hypothetical protein